MSEESKTALVDNNTRDELNALAEKEGIDPDEYSTKDDLAEAIIAQRESTSADEASTEVLGARNEIPGSIFPDETLEDVRERMFERDFGHLEGDDLDRARAVQEANWRLEDEINSRPGYIAG